MRATAARAAPPDGDRAAPGAYATAHVLRLRLGIIFIAVFWFPVWIVVPVLAAVFGPTHPYTVIIGSVQVAFGALGLALAGRPAVALFKGTRLRKLPKALWVVVWRGRLPEAPEARAGAAGATTDAL